MYVLSVYKKLDFISTTLKAKPVDLHLYMENAISKTKCMTINRY